MTILMLPPVDLPKSYTHTSTDWQIATSPTFADDTIVVQSRDDESHLTSIIFDVDLDTEKTYYSRARVVCDKAILEWSKIDIIKPTDYIKVAFDYAIPSVVMKPTISFNFDPMNMPSSLFTIKTTPMSTTSNAEHMYSTYIIEDINGTPVYFDIDHENLTSKTLTEVKLQEGMPYIVKVSHTSTSNDTSDMAAELIYVNNIPEIVLKSQTNNIGVSNGYTVQIDTIPSYKEMFIKLYEIDYEIVKETYSGSSTSYTKVIPASAFDTMSDKDYMLAIQVEKEDGSKTYWKYFHLRIEL